MLSVSISAKLDFKWHGAEIREHKMENHNINSGGLHLNHRAKVFSIEQLIASQISIENLFFQWRILGFCLHYNTVCWQASTQEHFIPACIMITTATLFIQRRVCSICLAAYNNNSSVEYGCLYMQKEAKFFVSITWRIVLRNLGEEGSLNPELWDRSMMGRKLILTYIALTQPPARSL